MKAVPASRRVSYLALEAPVVGQASHVHVHEIIRGLERRGWSVTLHCPSYTDGGRKPGVAGRFAEYMRVQWRLLRQVRKGDAIYVRGHFMAAPAALYARLRGLPIVHEINGPLQDIYVTYPWLRRVGLVLDTLQTLQYRLADHLLPVTADLARWLAAYAPKERISVVPNGANTDRFRPDVAPAADAPQGRYMVFFGGLAEWHGVEPMLAAVSDPAWPADVSLLVIGDGSKREAVKAAAAADPRIVWAGYVPYERVPGYVAPALGGLVTITNPKGRSATGLLPLKLFETLACGVPAVVTDFPGQADLVRQHDAGIVVPVDQPRAIAQAVAQLAADPEGARAMGRRGAAAVQAEHSWDARAGAVDAVLETLLDCASGTTPAIHPSRAHGG